MSDRHAIQSAIITLVENHAHFHEVTYEDVGGVSKPVAFDPETAPSHAPETLRVNEISSSFAEDKNHGRSQILRRTNWSYVLYLEWSAKEIDLAAFLDGLCQNIPFIAKTADNARIRLFLLKYDVAHPVQQGASTGTQAKLLFNAEVL